MSLTTGRQQATHVLMPALEALTPGGNAYLNEGDLHHQPYFQQALYGSSSAQLNEIKERYSPHNLFYGSIIVGSENWRVGYDSRLPGNYTRVEFVLK
ncbi:FAD fmn-containing isoamyl alcohol oxidase [Biscogniauxia marginata]|nr:FAD fmn-containing isoamyl alcohol oxidase [Biscogniauxia marginata]